MVRFHIDLIHMSLQLMTKEVLSFSAAEGFPLAVRSSKVLFLVFKALLLLSLRQRLPAIQIMSGCYAEVWMNSGGFKQRPRELRTFC
jgi:hypothetical protein